jgi:hypothetical protein
LFSELAPLLAAVSKFISQNNAMVMRAEEILKSCVSFFGEAEVEGDTLAGSDETYNESRANRKGMARVIQNRRNRLSRWDGLAGLASRPPG